MSFTPYVSAQDLVDALSEATYMAIFDDKSTGDRATVDASRAVSQVRNRAHAQTISWLPGIYRTLPAEPTVPPSTPAPFLLVDAELQIATILSYRRHPEYVRTYCAEPGGKMHAEWVEQMKRIRTAEIEIAPNDNPPEPKPRNVGGFVGSGNPADPAPKSKTFSDGTGIF